MLLTWCARERPWEIESEVAAQLAAPLNSAGNALHSFYPTVRAGTGRAPTTRTCRFVAVRNAPSDLMVSDEDVERLAAAARVLPPNTSAHLEEDFVMNLLETVRDYMLQTEALLKALEYFRENRWNDVRTPADLEQLMARFPGRPGWQHGARAAPVGLQLLDARTAAPQPQPPLPQHRRRRPGALKQ
jgi:hypothetical protein